MLGVDVAKDTLSVALVHPTSRQLQWHAQVPNTPAGVRQLLRCTPWEIPWVLEPTGRYGLAVAKQAQAAQRQVLLAPPRKAKAFLAAVRSRAKTDRLDSHGLALYGLSVPLRPYPIKSENVECLDQLLAARRGIAQALVSLGQQRAELPYAAEALLPALKALETQRAALDKQIAALTADTAAFPVVAALKAIPGIGPVTAAAVASCLQAKAFEQPDAFVAYIGLDVRVRDSGAAPREAEAEQAGGCAAAQAAVFVRSGKPREQKQPVQSAVRPGACQGAPENGGAQCHSSQNGPHVLVDRPPRNVL